MILLEPSMENILNQEASIYYKSDQKTFENQVQLTLRGCRFAGTCSSLHWVKLMFPLLFKYCYFICTFDLKTLIVDPLIGIIKETSIILSLQFSPSALENSYPAKLFFCKLKCVIFLIIVCKIDKIIAHRR